MAIYTKDQGTWKNVQNVFIKDTGSWQKVRSAFVKENGVWKQYISSIPNNVIIDGKLRPPRNGKRVLDIGAEPYDDATLYTGQGLYFNAPGVYISFPELALETYTITFIWRVPAGASSEQPFTASRATEDYALKMYDLEHMSTYLNGQVSDIIFDEPLEYDTFYHFVATRDSNNDIRLYINTVLQSMLGNIVGTMYFDEIAGNTNAWGNSFLGIMLNVQYWNEVFTQEDVDFIYQNPEKLAYEREGTLLSADNLQRWYLICEGAGSTVYNWKEDSNHGTIINYYDVEDGWRDAWGITDFKVPQIAYMEFTIDSSGIIKPPGHEGTQYTRELNQLNLPVNMYVTIPTDNLQYRKSFLVEFCFGDRIGPWNSAPLFKWKNVIASKLDMEFYAYYLDNNDNLIEKFFYMTTPFDPSVYYHVILLYDDRNVEGYVNGRLIFTDSISQSCGLSNEPILINTLELPSVGNVASQSFSYFKLLIDDEVTDIPDYAEWAQEQYNLRLNEGYLPRPVPPVIKDASNYFEFEELEVVDNESYIYEYITNTKVLINGGGTNVYLKDPGLVGKGIRLTSSDVYTKFSVIGKCVTFWIKSGYTGGYLRIFEDFSQRNIVELDTSTNLIYLKDRDGNTYGNASIDSEWNFIAVMFDEANTKLRVNNGEFRLSDFPDASSGGNLYIFYGSTLDQVTGWDTWDSTKLDELYNNGEGVQ